MKKRLSIVTLVCLVVVLAIAMLATAGCGKKLPLAYSSPVDTDVTNAADLPGSFNTLKMGMTTVDVQAAVGRPPATIQDKDGMRIYKYFAPGGTARIYLSFQDDKLTAIMKRTP